MPPTLREGSGTYEALTGPILKHLLHTTKRRSITTPQRHTQTEQILHQSCPSQACRQCDTQGILPAHAWASDPCPSLLAQGQPPLQSSSTLLPHSDAWFPAPFVYSPDMPQQAKLMSWPSKPESPQHPQCADNPLSPGAWGPHTRYVRSRAGRVQRVSPDQGSPSPEPSLPSVVVVVTFPSRPQTGPEPRKDRGGDGERKGRRKHLRCQKSHCYLKEGPM